jgi:chromosome segregation ATPase
LNRRAAEVAALQTEFEILRGTLAVAERDAREHAAAAEVLQGEIASLQAQLATAQSEARECVAAAAVMQREIASVRSELAVARTIGSAALAVLRTSSVPILEAHAAKRSQLVAGLLAHLGLLSGYPTALSR